MQATWSLGQNRGQSADDLPETSAICAAHRHISQKCRWCEGFLRDEAPYTDYFITVDPTTVDFIPVDPTTDLSQVLRPRTLPLLTPAETAHGTEWVWTTFSPDQINLNYANPQVLLEIVDVLQKG